MDMLNDIRYSAKQFHPVASSNMGKSKMAAIKIEISNKLSFLVNYNNTDITKLSFYMSSDLLNLSAPKYRIKDKHHIFVNKHHNNINKLTFDMFSDLFNLMVT